MAKLTLNSITSGYASTTALNDNFNLIETALENTLSRDGTSPNQMNADLDMNGYRILNELATSGEGFSWEGAWVTSTSYALNNLVSNSGSTYICTVAHTSGTFATDLSAGKWEIIASKGDAGAGTGDVLAANNLSEYTASATTARSNISAAKSGANSDITSLTGLTTALDETYGGTGQTSFAQGDILYASATNTLSKLTKGTALQQLRMNSGATVPEWFTPSSSSGGIGGETTYNTNTTLSVTTDHTYVIRCTTASVVYTFPAATGNEGKYWWITNQTSNDTGVRLVCNGAESIGGATGATIYIPAYTTFGFVSDNSNWLVFSRTPMFWEFNANGTWYCPPGVYEIEVDGSGGGGGGGGTGASDVYGGAGGGSGARCKGKKITTVPGTAYTVTIGAGGTGGTADDSVGSTGSSGSSTSLGALLTLAGGAGGQGGDAASATGGLAGDKGVDGHNSDSAAGASGGDGPRGAAVGVANGPAADANSGAGGGGASTTQGTGGAGGSGYLRVRA